MRMLLLCLAMMSCWELLGCEDEQQPPPNGNPQAPADPDDRPPGNGPDEPPPGDPEEPEIP